MNCNVFNALSDVSPKLGMPRREEAEGKMQSLAPPPLRSCRPLAGRLEDGPLDRRNPLLEAGWADPREARKGSKLVRELELA